MRILFLTRLHPLRKLGPLEARLHDRLTELSELGHEVLVLTKWTGEPVDFELPSRIEIRSPFKSFRPWEWPRALPMVFAWRPDLLHIFDPGLSKIERALSVEMAAVTMLDALSRAARGRSSYRGSLVSLAPGASAESQSGWKTAGAKLIENGWLRPVGAEKAVRPWGSAENRRLRIALAGEVGHDRTIDSVLDALSVMRLSNDFELSIFLDRALLSRRDRARLAQFERLEAFGSAVGSRLNLSHPDSSLKTADDFDVAIVAGLDAPSARAWIERLAMPVVISESQRTILSELEASGMSSQVLGPPVTEVAHIQQALIQALDRELLNQVWSKIEHGDLAVGRDVAANHLSRIYSQIAGRDSSSYS